MSATPITFIHVSNHYDHHLSGWCRVNGRYHYFTITKEGRLPVDDDPDDYDDDLEWSIYRAPRDVTLAHLRLVRQWRLLAGWNWDYAPGPPRCAKYKSTTQDYYKLPKPPEVDVARCELVGRTRDLRTMEAIDAAK